MTWQVFSVTKVLSYKNDLAVFMLSCGTRVVYRVQICIILFLYYLPINYSFIFTRLRPRI